MTPHRRQLFVGSALAGALAAALLLAPGAGDTLWPLAVLGISAVAATYLASGMAPTTLAVAGVVALAFSGNAGLIGLPIAPDRLLFPAAVAALVRDWWVVGPRARIVWKPVHFFMLALVVYAVVSAFWADTLFTQLGLFAILDRLAIPFALFFLAPLLFRTPYQRHTLLIALVGAGAYLSVLALLETLGPSSLVFPRYIANPVVGLHFGRARGPFLEAVANGMVLFQCGAAAAVATTVWRTLWARRFAAVVMGLCGLGTFLTLTRGIWLATILGAGAAMLMTPRLRRLLPRLAVGATAVLVALLVMVPSLSQKSYTRVNDERSVWDRVNSNNAAVRVIEDHPIFGIGWERFLSTGQDYLRQADHIPLTGANIEVHNVFLSRAAELGLVGLLLFLAVFVLGIGEAVFMPASGGLHPWRIAMVAIAVNWTVIALTTPLSYPMPNAILWLWAGVVLMPHHTAGIPIDERRSAWQRIRADLVRQPA